MILALDVGNTNIVIGCIDQDKTYFVGRISTDKSKTDLEYAIMFKSIIDINGVDAKNIEGAIISSVVPPLNSILSEAVLLTTGHTPLMVSDKINGCINIDIDNRSQLGNDLIVDSLAALAQYKPPLIIFDMGTATTISVVDKNSTYIGSVIMPGMAISQESLSSRTSQLPSISLDAPPNVIGKNTIHGMQSGLIHGNASMIDGMIDRIQDELGMDATVIATGGLSKFVVNHCRHNVIYDNDLLLKGLWIIYNQNK